MWQVTRLQKSARVRFHVTCHLSRVTLEGMSTGQARRASVLTSVCLRARGAGPRHSASLRSKLRLGEPCARSSKRAGGLIPRIALDECRDPERYRTCAPVRTPERETARAVPSAGCEPVEETGRGFGPFRPRGVVQPTRLLLKQEIAGANPAGDTISARGLRGIADPPDSDSGSLGRASRCAPTTFAAPKALAVMRSLGTRANSVQLRPWAPPRVAQLAEAPRSRREGCRCDSCHADQSWNVNRASEPGLGANECVPSGTWGRTTAFRSLQTAISARSSKKTGGPITRVALDQCRVPERYRTRAPFRTPERKAAPAASARGDLAGGRDRPGVCFEG